MLAHRFDAVVEDLAVVDAKRIFLLAGLHQHHLPVLLERGGVRVLGGGLGAVGTHLDLNAGLLHAGPQAVELQCLRRGALGIAQFSAFARDRGGGLGGVVGDGEGDFICFNSIIVELKALDSLASEHESQLINYLKATNKPLGILINFGKPSLQYKRIINSSFFNE